MLGREDIKRQSEPFSYKVKEEEKTTVVHSPMFTSGIAYIKLLFDMNVIPKEDLPYASLLSSVLGLCGLQKIYLPGILPVRSI